MFENGRSMRIQVQVDLDRLTASYRPFLVFYAATLLWCLSGLGVEPLMELRPGATSAVRLLILGSALAIFGGLAFYGYRRASALGSGVSWLWAIAMLVALVNVIAPLMLILRTREACQALGFPLACLDFLGEGAGLDAPRRPGPVLREGSQETR